VQSQKTPRATHKCTAMTMTVAYFRRLLLLVASFCVVGSLWYRVCFSSIVDVKDLFVWKDSPPQLKPRLVTGNASSWHVLPMANLTEYFTPTEIDGLLTKQCGSIFNYSNPWRWQGSVGVGNRYVPCSCCPNGHMYGALGLPMNDTTPLYKVEVTSDGHIVQPFQIRELITTMDRLYRQTASTEQGQQQSPSIWILGDSTSNQMFYAFLCGFIRIGATVLECELVPVVGGYGHRFCNTTRNAGTMDLASDTTTNVTHQFLTVQLEDGRRYQVHHFMDALFCHTKRQVNDYCLAHDKRFWNFATTQLSKPDMFLINYGVHAANPDQLQSGITILLNLLSPFTDALIWRETKITHFPDVAQSGIFETWQRDKLLGLTNDITCADVTDSSTFWRQHVTRAWLSDFHDVPILSMNETEMHMYETYPIPIMEKGRADCVHYVYTPLYWDSFFWRLSQLLKVKEGFLEQT
jgi:hypothetical protein